MAGGSKIGTFFFGLFIGLILAGLLTLGAGFYLMQNPQKILNKVKVSGARIMVEKQIQRAMVKTVNTIPKSYVAMHQDDIIQRFEKLTVAYSTGALTVDDIYLLYSEFFEIAGDGALHPEEVDVFLSKVDSVIVP